MRIRSQQLTPKSILNIWKDNSTWPSAVVEMRNTPLSAGSPGTSHAEVRDTEGRRVYPLHNNLARLAVADQNSAAPPFDCEFPEFIRIHNAWGRYLNLRVNIEI